MADLKQRLEDFLNASGVALGRGKTPKLRCPSPEHADERPSAVLYRDSQRVYCPVCGKHWDVFDVAGLLNGETEFVKQKEIVERALGVEGDGPRGARPDKPQKTQHGPVALTTDDARRVYSRDEIERRGAENWGEIAGHWAYRDETGRVVGMDVRFERQDGAGAGVRKSVITFWWDGRKLQTQNAPYFLYNRDRLEAEPTTPALVVEGCKAAAAAEAIPGFIPVTWPGGSARAGKPDWSPLKGRRVYIYPDDDQKADREGVLKPWHEQPGMKAALEIKRALRHAKIVRPLEAARAIKADGADIVEALQVATPEQIRDYILGSPEVNPSPDAEDAEARPDAEWVGRMLETKSGEPKLTLANLILIFTNDPAWAQAIGFNARTQCVVFTADPPDGIYASAGDVLTDEHVSRAAGWLQDHYELVIRNPSVVFQALVAVAHLHPFDPVAQWLDSLAPWDGVPRLASWIADVTGAPANTYHSEVGRIVLVSAVARVYRPGCKVDTVLVLHGPQGSLKSTLLAELAGRPEWFSDHLSDIGGKDAAMGLCGPWILEFSELDAITGKRESERVKAWITQQRDRFRPPYGRVLVDVPRRTIFAGTSNLHQFLRDETGGRRFLPVEIKRINLGALREMRVQLWAEARARFKAGESWWLEGDALAQARTEQEDRRVPDPWEQPIRAWLASPSAHGKDVTSSLVLSDCIKMELARQTKSDLDRCGRILGTVLGWTRAQRRISGVVTKVWMPPKREGEQEVIDISAARAAAIDDEPTTSRFGGKDW